MIDIEKAAELFQSVTGIHAEEEKPSLSKEDLCQQLVATFFHDAPLSDAETENVLCNYIYIVEVVRRDLDEIENRLDRLKKEDQETPSDDKYAHDRLRYFSRINKEARDKILEYLANGLSAALYESKGKKWAERESDEASMLLFDSRYDYAFFRKYYDPDYDFSTEAKFRFALGVNLFSMLETVQEKIDLKAKSPDEFAHMIDSTVSEEHYIQSLRDKVYQHYYLNRRGEIFDTLVDLYTSGKYVSFITLAIVQLEGIFYDCLTILNRKELGSKAGTLVEKVDKVFSSHKVTKQALYPYFAFDVPNLRNEIAHNGIIGSENLEHLCNETILDIWCIVDWACQLSDDKYKALCITCDRLQEKREQEPDCDADSIVFMELLGNYQVCDREFLKVLSTPDAYDEELLFYKSLADDSGNGKLSIWEITYKISDIVKSEAFWNYINNAVLPDIPSHEKGKPYDCIDFVTALRDEFIPKLKDGSPEKIACQRTSALLKRY